jgi:hypothetical protein
MKMKKKITSQQQTKILPHKNTPQQTKHFYFPFNSIFSIINYTLNHL